MQTNYFTFFFNEGEIVCACALVQEEKKGLETNPIDWELRLLVALFSLSLSKFNQMCVKSFFNCLENCCLFFYTADCDCWDNRDTTTRWWCSVLIQTDGLRQLSVRTFFFFYCCMQVLRQRICCVNVTKYYSHSSVWAASNLVGCINVERVILL